MSSKILVQHRRQHPYAVTGPKAEDRAVPKKSVVTVLETSYHLNASKSKKVTVALDAGDFFKTVVILENPTRPADVVLLAADEWMELVEQQVNISSYLSSALHGEDETTVAELRRYVITVGALYGKPTVLFYAKLNQNPDDDKKKSNYSMALQCGTWDNLMKCVPVMSLNVDQRLQWGYFCSEYFEEFVESVRKELEPGTCADKLVNTIKYPCSVKSFPPASLNYELFTLEIRLLCKGLISAKLKSLM